MGQSASKHPGNQREHLLQRRRELIDNRIPQLVKWDMLSVVAQKGDLVLLVELVN